MSRRICALLVLASVLLYGGAGSSNAADKGNKKQQAKREKAIQGDGILFALAHSDELKLTKQQETYLQKLKAKLADERAKEPEEIKIGELRDEMRTARKAGKPDEAKVFQDQMKELLEKQGAKWEERTNAELAKLLPKEMQDKLKELRGDPEPPMVNPFSSQ